jgi:lipopolysaccharide/colanic/teichoic acid biosynthesis glycosyltransferase
MSTGRCDGAHEAGRLHVVGEDLFKGILTRERKRSDRSNRPFALFLLGLRRGVVGRPDAFLGSVLPTLAATKRETDIAGWMAGRALIGVIFSDIRASDPREVCARIKTRLRRELVRQGHAETLAQLSIRFHVYPEPRCPGEAGRWPVDPLFYPELSPRPGRGATYDPFKRGLDIVASLSLLIALSPLLLAIAALVRLGSRGTVLFRQVRLGRMTKPFTMLKFRTMYAGVDEKVHQDYVSTFIKADGRGAPGEPAFFKLTNDPRVTPVGRLLRKTSLDELPQLWNVLRGDMSLVGPRPPLPYELEQYDPWHRGRLLEAMPGITGLWQVVGRSRTTFDEMVRLDLRYARTRSLWSDIKILLATPAAVLSGRGAC